MELVKKFLFFLFLLFTCNYHYFPCIFSVFTWKKNSGSGFTAQAFRYRRTGTYTIINRALPRRWRILLCSRNTWLARSRTSYKRDTYPLALKQWGIMRDYSVLAHPFLSMYSMNLNSGIRGKGKMVPVCAQKMVIAVFFLCFCLRLNNTWQFKVVEEECCGADAKIFWWRLSRKSVFRLFFKFFNSAYIK